MCGSEVNGHLVVVVVDVGPTPVGFFAGGEATGGFDPGVPGLGILGLLSHGMV